VESGVLMERLEVEQRQCLILLLDFQELLPCGHPKLVHPAAQAPQPTEQQ
jgi:hypothetical protein